MVSDFHNATTVDAVQVVDVKLVEIIPAVRENHEVECMTDGGNGQAGSRTSEE